MKENIERLDLNKFDNYLNYELYIKNKLSRKVIISIYKKYLRLQKNILEFEEYLYDLGFYEITTGNISKYILNWNYRVEMNRRIEKYEKRC